VRNQTYRNIEILVVDDGSQDQTRHLVRALAEEDDRITLLCQANQGVAAARNLAIEQARGVYIAPLDADDIWLPEKLERQVVCMEQGGPGMGLVYSWWVMIDEDDVLLQASSKWSITGDVFEALIFINFIGNASVPLMRSTCIEEVGGYSTLLKEMGGQGCEDWDLALRIAAQYTVGMAPGYLCGYRRVRNSMSMDCKSMGQSHHLIIERIRRHHSQIPSCLFRWSGSTFYSYLGRLSYRGGNYQDAKQWFLKALAVDAMLMLSLPFLKLLVKSLLRIPGGPMLFQSLRVQKAWQKRKLASSRGLHTLDRLTKDHGAYPRSWTWKSRRPFDWISWYRWRKVTMHLSSTQADVRAASLSKKVQVQRPQMQRAG
jgi:glycosyltransferase involved in cell wall biosynthesis